MKKIYSFSIPDLPPSLDSIYKTGRGKIYKCEEAHVFERICQYTLPKIKDTITFPVVLYVSFTFKDPQKYKMSDTDNRLKVTFDTLQSCGIIKNDNLIVSCIARRVLGAKEEMSGFFFEESDPDYIKILSLLE